MPQQRIRYTDEQLLGIATKVLNKTGWKVDPTYIASIARVESQGDPYAYRFEAEYDDASMGLCQSLLKNNAQWLHKSFPKYGAAGGVPYPEKGSDLAHPETAMYFGAAYLDFLMNITTLNESKTLEWSVKAYNGGPNGTHLAGPTNYWKKFQPVLEKMKKVRPVSVDLSNFVTTDGTIVYALVEEDAGDFDFMAASLKRKFGVSATEIKRLNPSAEWCTGGIMAGLKLRLPNSQCQACGYGGGSTPPPPSQTGIISGAQTHTVVRGDTGYAMMRKYAISLEDLRRINPSVNFNFLPVGTVLKVSVDGGKKRGTCPLCGGVPAKSPVQAVTSLGLGGLHNLLLRGPLALLLGGANLTGRGVQGAGSGLSGVVKLVTTILKTFPGLSKRLAAFLPRR
mmetsp:Transcript_26684/g.44738  ORF Transcript_26684/g.44738 Transcript_26684/m.44738 type:complete len:395 (-) Transcript_26684:240-1424(-)|eukprot:CAMPEP_0198220782 /NCGR_PEP_ID=MMETSP1445-20131203/80669_1 /TAXON_ID=36898 /ORGANISM="Pyramimonas sp., Strain CCMP2087" /LENGTH=394 /DNA_ID=CAMNT_0043898677 /DNA_START=81 /DNA_END=1265 /DNA_ORIENTATION=-